MTGVPCVSPILVLSSLSAVTSSPRLQARNERGQGQARRAGGQARAQPGAGGRRPVSWACPARDWIRAAAAIGETAARG